MKKIKILLKTEQLIIQTLSERPVESGGIIGQRDGIVCAFEPDPGWQNQEYWIPDVEYLNQIIQRWTMEGIRFIGMVHSHKSVTFPSIDDTNYAKIILETTGMKEILLPVLVPHIEKPLRYYCLVSDLENCLKIDVKYV